MEPANPLHSERSRGAALRDLAAGGALLGLGLVTGGSSLRGSLDGVDLFFDALALAWIGWGAFRLIRAR